MALQVIESEEIEASETEVLDFGFEAGDFQVSCSLQPHVKSVIGAAINPTAVEAFTEYARKAGLSEDQMHAIALPHMSDLAPLKGKQFDVIVVSQPLDQRPDIVSTIPMLASQFLKPGGALYVAALDMNWLPPPPPFLGHHHRYPGKEGHDFDDSAIKKLFEEAGLEAYELRVVDTYGSNPLEPGKLYVATGYKAVGDDFSIVDTSSKVSTPSGS